MLTIEELLKKKINGLLTAEEELQLLEWASRSPENQGLLDEVTDDDLLQQQLQAYYLLTRKDPGSYHEKVYEQVISKIKRDRVPSLRRWYYAVAVLLVALSVGIYFINERKRASLSAVPGAGNTPADIQPGGNRATLTMANGNTISLDSAQSGIIVSDEGINYSNGNAVLAERQQSPRATGAYDATSATYNSVSTPRGGQYQIILSDGSKVWLNAASKLTYPVYFTGDRREVELSGEAYFEIAQGGKHPFIVRSNGQQVQVLGTEFNVSAYVDEANTKTTLVDGALQVSCYAGMNSKHPISESRLIPGEQSILSENQLSKRTVDIDQEISWKNGLFDFTGKTLDQIMAELSRWYNIDVLFEGPMPNTRFLGQIYRNSTLEQVLRILENAQVHFRLEKQKLIIHNEN